MMAALPGIEGQDMVLTAGGNPLTFTIPARVEDWGLELAEPTILVADDDEQVLDLITVKLETAGFHAITSDNGSTALRMIQDEQPDMVILDVVMPGLDGLFKDW
jgi:PleD family two-component response regulator